MRILFFDTETNGLPHVRKAPVRLVENWPRIVQIAWQIVDITETSCFPQPILSHILRQDPTSTWDAGSERIHGISKERTETEGRLGKDVCAEFVEDALHADVIVAHNLEFDKPVVLAECIRNGLGVDWWPTKEFCTMKHTTPLLKLPTKYSKPHDPYKYPSLKEMAHYLFGTTESFAFHTAGGDVECVVKCFLELLRRRVLDLESLR